MSLKVWKNELFVSGTLLASMIGAVYHFATSVSEIKRDIKDTATAMLQTVSRAEAESWVFAVRAMNPLLSFPDFPNY